MLKKIVISLGTLALAALLAFSATGSGAMGEARSTSSPTIALVNEDEAASFNGQTYLFGKEFVSMVSNDSRYSWAVSSRSVAEKAYADKAVSAVIYLPRSFSRDLLTLENLNPVTADIQYKVVDEGDSARQRLENRVSAVLRDFNSRIVQMYFASIAGNISGAQVNVSSIVDRQSALVGALSDELRPDVESVEKSESTTVSLADLLKGLNAAWISAQNGFTKGTTSTLTSTSEALSRQQTPLSEYFAQQEQIARTNVANGNAAITEQGTSDKRFYDEAFAEHIRSLLAGDGTWSGLEGFSSTDTGGTPSGVFATLTDAVARYDALAAEYNGRVNETAGALTGQQNELTDSILALQSLEESLLREYFGATMPVDDANYAVDVSTLTDAQARPALAAKLANTFTAEGTSATAVKLYEDQLEDAVAQIPTDPDQYTALFDTLEANPNFKAGPYLEQLAIITEYANGKGIASPALTVVHPAAAAAQTATTSLPVEVPAGARTTVSATLPPTLSPGEVTVGIPSPTPDCVAHQQGCVTVDPSARTATVDNSKGAEKLMVSLTYDIDLTNIVGSVAVEYTAHDTFSTAPAPAARSLGSDVYLLAPADPTTAAIGGDDFAAITEYLGRITSAGELLRFLYGAPGESRESFSASILLGGDFDGHSSESVFNRYGSIDAVVIADYLDARDVAAYAKLGRDNITAIVAQISALHKQRQTTAENIAALSGPQLQPGHFSEAVSQLADWYNAAMVSVTASPAQWEAQSNTVIQLETVPWRDQEEGKAELYVDDRTGPALHAQLSALIASTSSSAANVAASAQIIEDNSDQFDTLLEGARRTQTDTRAVLAAMDGTIASANDALTQGSEFSRRFSTVLSNTRANGADPAHIYETFASPVTTTDVTPTDTAASSSPIDWRWGPIFLAGGLIGGLLSWLLSRRKRRGGGAGGRVAG